MAVGSFSSGLSGLSANQTYLSVIGNNLANINTVAYKGSMVNFADLVSQTVGSTSTNPAQIGLGVATGSISPIFTQGGIDNSPIATHVAIQGSGFFMVANNSGVAYTRAGDFTFDADGRLQTPDGWAVQGYTALDPLTGQVVTTGMPTDIVIPPGDLRPPVATTSFEMDLNLDASAPIAGAGAEYVTAVRVYDSRGEEHMVTLTFNRTTDDTWEVSGTVPGEDVGQAPGTTFPVLAATQLTFDANGELTAPGDVQLAVVNWANGATSPQITWDFTPDGGEPTVTSYNEESAQSSIVQNGAPPGQVNSVSINSEGQIVASYGAGQSVVVGQLAMANFNNPAGLTRIGGNRFGETQAAGEPNIGVPGTGGRGEVVGNALESSNVDIAQEFTKMILAQRGYQANSRSITTADEVIVETLSLKR